MPSGAKKRKAAKKKQVSSTNPLHGENDSQGSNKTLDPLVEVVEKRENSSSENQSKGEGSIEIEIGSKSKNSSSSSSDSSDDEDKVVEKKVVVVESAPVSESVSVVETISPVVDSIKPVDSLVEEVSKVCDEVESEEKKDLVVEETVTVTETETETPLVVEDEAVVGSESCLKDDLPTSSVVVESVLKENEEEKLPVVEEKDYSEPKEEYAASSVSVKDSVSEVSGVDCVNETATVEHSDRQAHPAASVPLAVHKTTSWKSCCGIFELFSGSGR